MTNHPDWLKIRDDTIIFEIPPTRTITYEELPKAVDEVFKHFSKKKTDVIKITGRGPIWLYSAIVHIVAHLTKAVAVYDAINNTYVIVVSHHPKYRIGEKLVSASSNKTLM